MSAAVVGQCRVESRPDRRRGRATARPATATGARRRQPRRADGDARRRREAADDGAGPRGGRDAATAGCARRAGAVAPAPARRRLAPPARAGDVGRLAEAAAPRGARWRRGPPRPARPEARTRISSPRRTPSVATPLRLRALTGPRPEVTSVTVTSASKPAAVRTSAAAGRACSPSGFATVSRSSSCGPASRQRPRRAGRVVAAAPRPDAGRPPAPAARPWPPGRRAPPAATCPERSPSPAATAAATAPSTNGAAVSRTRAAALLGQQIQGHLRREHGAAEVHEDQHAVVGPDLVDGSRDPRGVGAERRRRAGPGRRRRRCAAPRRPSGRRARPRPRRAWRCGRRGPARPRCTVTPAAAGLARCPARAASVSGRRLQQQPRRRRARILVAGAALAEVAGAPLARHQRDGRQHALLGGVGRRAQGVAQRPSGRGGLVERRRRRQERVDHRLVARLGLAAHLHALDAGPEGGGPARQVQLGRVAGRLAHLQEERAVQRAGRAADGRDQRHPDRLQERADVGRRRGRAGGAGPAPGGAGALPAEPAPSFAATACMPRSMLMPWSASPMAASSVGEVLAVLGRRGRERPQPGGDRPS